MFSSCVGYSDMKINFIKLKRGFDFANSFYFKMSKRFREKVLNRPKQNLDDVNVTTEDEGKFKQQDSMYVSLFNRCPGHRVQI